MTSNKQLLDFQVVNQWETNSSQMPKQRKLEESRTSALRFCKFTFILRFMSHYITSRLLLTLPKILIKAFFCCVVGRQRFVRDVLNAAPVVCESEEEAQRGRLHFYRPAAKGHMLEKQIPHSMNQTQQVKTSWHDSKKRQRQSERSDSSHDSPPTKRLPSSALSAEDIELLNSY